MSEHQLHVRDRHRAVSGLRQVSCPTTGQPFVVALLIEYSRRFIKTPITCVFQGSTIIAASTAAWASLIQSRGHQMTIPNQSPLAPMAKDQPPRRLDISDLERIERFRRAGYGGSVSDCSMRLTSDTVLSDRRPLRQGMQLVGRALPIKIHATVEPADDQEANARERRWEAAGGHPQKRMMRAVEAAEDGRSCASTAAAIDSPRTSAR